MLDKVLFKWYNISIAEKNFASVLKNIKKDLDKDKRICYNKYIGKQKSILQNLEKWIDKIKIICYTI